MYNSDSKRGVVKPLKITRDSGANVRVLKKLEAEGYIEIYDVMLENGRQNRKIQSKILPTGVYGHSRFDECVYGGEEGKYSDIKNIVGSKNIEDAMHLEAHLRNGHDIFVTEDKRDILSNRNDLEKHFGIIVFSPQELIEICNTHQ